MYEREGEEGGYKWFSGKRFPGTDRGERKPVSEPLFQFERIEGEGGKRRGPFLTSPPGEAQTKGILFE